MSQLSAYLFLKNNFQNQENNELKELSECRFYKMLAFFEKCLKTVKLSFTKHFQKTLLVLL